MTDLTKMTLEEVRELVEGTVDGTAVRIYANDCGGNFPIHGAIFKEDNCLLARVWTKEGFIDSLGECRPKVLKLKSKTIDFSKLPVDTLVKVEGRGFMYLTGSRDHKIRHYQSGCTSKTVGVPPFMHEVKSEEIELAKGRIEPWFGGECPLPDGVEVEVWYRNSRLSSGIHDAAFLGWKHYSKALDIIAYQITGNIV